MNELKVFSKKLENVLIDTSLLTNALDFFYDIFSSNQIGGYVENADKMCDWLYILNEYARQLKKRISDIEEMNMKLSVY